MFTSIAVRRLRPGFAKSPNKMIKQNIPPDPGRNRPKTSDVRRKMVARILSRAATCQLVPDSFFPGRSQGKPRRAEESRRNPNRAGKPEARAAMPRRTEKVELRRKRLSFWLRGSGAFRPALGLWGFGVPGPATPQPQGAGQAFRNVWFDFFVTLSINIVCFCELARCNFMLKRR